MPVSLIVAPLLLTGTPVPSMPVLRRPGLMPIARSSSLTRTLENVSRMARLRAAAAILDLSLPRPSSCASFFSASVLPVRLVRPLGALTRGLLPARPLTVFLLRRPTRDCRLPPARTINIVRDNVAVVQL